MGSGRRYFRGRCEGLLACLLACLRGAAAKANAWRGTKRDRMARGCFSEAGGTFTSLLPDAPQIINQYLMGSGSHAGESSTKSDLQPGAVQCRAAAFSSTLQVAASRQRVFSLHLPNVIPRVMKRD